MKQSGLWTLFAIALLSLALYAALLRTNFMIVTRSTGWPLRIVSRDVGETRTIWIVIRKE